MIPFCKLKYRSDGNSSRAMLKSVGGKTLRATSELGAAQEYSCPNNCKALDDALGRFVEGMPDIHT